MDEIADAVAARLDPDASAGSETDASDGSGPGAIGERAVDRVRPLSGGQIGEVYRVDLADGRAVVAKRSETPLSVEAAMLAYLGERGLPVPAVLSADDDLLVLAFVPGDTEPSAAAERDVADQLAALHEHTAPAFGFERDTLLGPLGLPNPWTDEWIPFFREHRLLHFAGVAFERDAIDRAALERVRALADDLDALLTEPDAPALLHGDVWRENVLVRDDAVAAFLDPACYYGHPEEELAYVRWSSAFGDAFFERYAEHRPIEAGFAERQQAYAVPRVLVHAICFGEPYPETLSATLDALGY